MKPLPRSPHAIGSWLLLLVLLLLATGPARAARGDPVVIDSPSWNALMARPAADGGITAFYAADLLQAWGRPGEAEGLRRRLLARHLRGLAGERLPPATLSELWQTAPPASDELSRLHARAVALQPGASWASLDPANDGAVRLIVERIGNRPPPDLDVFLGQWGPCECQGTCSTRGCQALISDTERSERLQARLKQMEQRQAESQRKHRERQRRDERLLQAVTLGYLLGGLMLYLIVARQAGTKMATAAVVALGALLAMLLFARTGRVEGWGGLALLVIGGGLAGSGLLLAPVYHWIYKRWFAGR
jgi:hypothetical protein